MASQPPFKADCGARRTRREARNAARQSGFTLLETLVALAILSVSALLIFQFVGQQFGLTNRVERLSSASLSSAIDRDRFVSIVAGLTPGWRENNDQEFSGNPARFSGLTTGQIESLTPGLSLVSMQIIRDAVGQGCELVYHSETADYVVARFKTPASFSYLGADGVWRNEWPPERMPDAGKFDDAGMYVVLRPLPLAIRLRLDDGSQLDWVAAVDWRSPRIPRRQDQEIVELR